MHRSPVVLSLLAAGALVLTGCGGDESTTSAPPSAAPPSASTSAAAPGAPAVPSATPSTADDVVGTVTITGGQPRGGVQRISTEAGKPAVLTVTSDTATELHVHGADRYVDIPPNTPTAVDVSQPAGGSYEVEDHESGALLAQLRVS